MEHLWNTQVSLASAEPHASFFKLLSEFKPPGDDAHAESLAQSASAQTKKYKWSTAADTAFKFRPALASPCPALDGIDWKQDAKGVDRSEGGAGGVFFVDTRRGAVVVKASRTIAPEIFASFLCFQLGVLAPRTRLLRTDSEEGGVLLSALKALDPSWRVVTNLFDQVFLLVQDFVPGFSLASMDYFKSEKVFGSEVADAATPEEAERFKQLGRLMAVDVLLNNGDRLPLVWSNSGNPSNIMVSTVGGGYRLVSIDARLCCIQTSSTLFDEYLGKVRALVSALKQSGALDDDTRPVAPEFSGIQQRLVTFLGLDVGVKGSTAIQAGFCEVVRRCKAQQSEIKQAAASWRDALAGIEQQASVLDLENVKLPFFYSVLDAVVGSA